jgi:hypothetical protein
LLAELNELREDNARLRIEATRPPALTDVAAGLHCAAGVDEHSDDVVDEAVTLLAEAQRQRSVVRGTLEALRAACEQLEQQLELGVGSMELERRRTDRRAIPELAGPAPDERADRAVDLAMQFARALRQNPTGAHRLLERTMRAGGVADLAVALAAMVDPTQDPETLLAWTDDYAVCSEAEDHAGSSPHAHGTVERWLDGCRGRACVLAADRDDRALQAGASGEHPVVDAAPRSLSIAYPDEPERQMASVEPLRRVP